MIASAETLPVLDFRRIDGDAEERAAFPGELRAAARGPGFFYLAGLALSGAIIVLLPDGLWWLTYADVIGYDDLSLSNAGACLVSNTDICQLAKSLCRGAHSSAIIGQGPASIRIGAAVLRASPARDT